MDQLTDWIEGEIAKHEREVYGGKMPTHAKRVLRHMLRKEDKFYAFFDRDHMPGFDDGEPQTTADYNR